MLIRSLGGHVKGIALHVGQGTHREGLTVFPIWQEHTEGLPVSIVGERLARVGELAAPAVPSSRSWSSSPAATGPGSPLMARGVLDGDRLLQASVINRQVVAA